MSISIEEVRRILGRKGEEYSDEQLAKLLAGIESLAGELYDRASFRAAVDIDRVRWAAHAHENGDDGEDIATPLDDHDIEAANWIESLDDEGEE